MFHTYFQSYVSEQELTVQRLTDSPVTNVSILLYTVAGAEELGKFAFQSTFTDSIFHIFNDGELTTTQLQREAPSHVSVWTGQHYSLHPGGATRRKLLLPLLTHIHGLSLLFTNRINLSEFKMMCSKKAPGYKFGWNFNTHTKLVNTCCGTLSPCIPLKTFCQQQIYQRIHWLHFKGHVYVFFLFR